MEAGIKLEFTGKTALIGEKTFFAKKDKKTEDETTTEMLAPSMKASDAFTLAINKAKGKINDEDKDAVVNYTIQPLVLSCLKDGKIVELKDTLFVPTYNIYYTTTQEGKDDIVTYLGEDLEFATVSGTEKPAEFVFRANADGSYAMMGTDANVSFDEDITAGTNVVSVDPTTGTKFSTEEVLLYNLSEGSFASVAVKVQDNSDKTTLPAESRHASFDNALGSINYQLNKNGITEGILSAESMIFWLIQRIARLQLRTSISLRVLRLLKAKRNRPRECSCITLQTLCLSSMRTLLRLLSTRSICWKVQLKRIRSLR